MSGINSGPSQENGNNEENLLDGKFLKRNAAYDGRIIIFALKGDPTNYYCLMKPLVLAKELSCPYVLSIVDVNEEWYSKIHPERYVPALKDKDSETGQELTVFESTACMQYLAGKYDADGIWTGRTACERAAVLSWTASQTASLGPTAKYWLYFLKGYPNRQNLDPPFKAVAKLRENVIKQWDILNERLSLPEQNYIALPDRPTIADLAFFPYAMPRMFSNLSVDIKDWPHIWIWAQKMLSRPAIKTVLTQAPSYGH